MNVYYDLPSRAAAPLADRPALAAALAALRAVHARPHGLVLAHRWQAGRLADATLHARLSEAEAAPLLRPDLAAAVGPLRARAASIGCRLEITHVSWLESGAQTLYYQVIPCTTRS